MYHTLTCNLQKLPLEPDFDTWKLFNHSFTVKYKPEKLLKLYHAKLASSVLEADLDKIKSSLPIEIINSAAYVALFENLDEFALNSIDAKADGITIRVPTALINQSVTLSYADTGSGFTKEFLNNQETLDYGSKVSKELGIQSMKTKTDGGGAGIGLGISYHFVHDHGGTLTIGNHAHGALIMLSSPPGTEKKLDRQFHQTYRKISNDVDEKQSIKLFEKVEASPPEQEQNESTENIEASEKDSTLAEDDLAEKLEIELTPPEQEQKKPPEDITTSETDSTLAEDDILKEEKYDLPTPIKKKVLLGLTSLIIAPKGESRYKSNPSSTASLSSDSSKSTTSTESYSPKFFASPAEMMQDPLPASPVVAVKGKF